MMQKSAFLSNHNKQKELWKTIIILSRILFSGCMESV